jgi:hypothetical protein
MGQKELDLSKPTISVPEAGAHFFGLGRNASYEAVKRGEIPVVKIGKILRVPVAAVQRMLDEAHCKESVAP